jgi:OOP family OmpA-OmpF porin
MKKILSLCTVLFVLTSDLDARNSYDDIGYMSFKYGLTSLEDSLSLDQHTFAVDFIGEVGHQIKPRLDFSYVSVDDKYGVDSLFQTSINAFFKSDYGYQNIIPYFYGGLGYEYVSGAKSDFDSNFYLQEGAGIEIPISQPSDDLHIVTELRLMQIIGGENGQDSEISLFIGLRLPIGNTFSNYSNISRSIEPSGEYPELIDDTTLPAPEEFVDSFEESSTVKINPNSQHDFSVDADGDGVSDGIDICPNTPSDSAVNKVGCPIKDSRRYVEKPRKTFSSIRSKTSTFKSLPNLRKILDVHFELNSDRIAEESRVVIRKFVNAVNHTSSKITVEGYTDNTGRYDQNIALSKRRAEAVKKLMIQYGVDSSRIRSVGKGSKSPIATNDTERGRAENRRIEIVVE